MSPPSPPRPASAHTRRKRPSSPTPASSTPSSPLADAAAPAGPSDGAPSSPGNSPPRKLPRTLNTATAATAAVAEAGNGNTAAGAEPAAVGAPAPAAPSAPAAAPAAAAAAAAIAALSAPNHRPGGVVAPLAEVSGMTVKEFVELIGKMRSALRELIPRPPPAVAAPDAAVEPAHWANLLSMYYHVPHVRLDAPVVLFGRAQKCHVQFAEDTGMPPALLRILGAGRTHAFLEPLAQHQLQHQGGTAVPVCVNGVAVWKGRVVIRSGDEISFSTERVKYSYVFQLLTTSESSAAAAQALVSEPAGGQNGGSGSNNKSGSESARVASAVAIATIAARQAKLAATLDKKPIVVDTASSILSLAPSAAVQKGSTAPAPSMANAGAGAVEIGKAASTEKSTAVVERPVGSGDASKDAAAHRADAAGETSQKGTAPSADSVTPTPMAVEASKSTSAAGTGNGSCAPGSQSAAVGGKTTPAAAVAESERVQKNTKDGVPQKSVSFGAVTVLGEGTTDVAISGGDPPATKADATAEGAAADPSATETSADATKRDAKKADAKSSDPPRKPAFFATQTISTQGTAPQSQDQEQSKRNAENDDEAEELDRLRREARTAAVGSAVDEYLKQALVDLGASETTFEKFPYSYLSTEFRDLLIAWAYTFLRHPDVVDRTELSKISPPRMLLSGASGTELYLEEIVRALAQHFGAHLLVIDLEDLCDRWWLLREPAGGDEKEQEKLLAALDKEAGIEEKMSEWRKKRKDEKEAQERKDGEDGSDKKEGKKATATGDGDKQVGNPGESVKADASKSADCGDDKERNVGGQESGTDVPESTDVDGDDKMKDVPDGEPAADDPLASTAAPQTAIESASAGQSAGGDGTQEDDKATRASQPPDGPAQPLLSGDSAGELNREAAPECDARDKMKVDTAGPKEETSGALKSAPRSTPAPAAASAGSTVGDADSTEAVLSKSARERLAAASLRQAGSETGAPVFKVGDRVVFLGQKGTLYGSGSSPGAPPSGDMHSHIQDVVQAVDGVVNFSGMPHGSVVKVHVSGKGAPGPRAARRGRGSSYRTSRQAHMRSRAASEVQRRSNDLLRISNGLPTILRSVWGGEAGRSGPGGLPYGSSVNAKGSVGAGKNWSLARSGSQDRGKHPRSVEGNNDKGTGGPALLRDPYAPKLGVASSSKISKPSKLGDSARERVRVLPGHAGGSGPSGDGTDDVGPTPGDVGQVVLTFEDDAKRVGVRFDSPISGGNNLGNLCEHTHGFFCVPEQLALEGDYSSAKKKPVLSLIDALFSKLKSRCDSSDSPAIVVLRDAERSLNQIEEKDPKFFDELESHLKGLSERMVVIGTSVPNDIRSFRPGGSAPGEHSPSGRGSSSELGSTYMLAPEKAAGALHHFLMRHPDTGGNGRGCGSGCNQDSRNGRGDESPGKSWPPVSSPSFGHSHDSSFIDNLTRVEDRLERLFDGSGKSPRSQGRLFPLRYPVETPPRDSLLHVNWKKELERDIKKLTARVNKGNVSDVCARLNVNCAQLVDVKELSDKLLTTREIESIVCLAVSAEMMEQDRKKVVPSAESAKSVEVEKPSETTGPSTSEGQDKEASEKEVLKVELEPAALSRGFALGKTLENKDGGNTKPWTSQALKDVHCENEFERKLLSEVVPAAEVGVKFDDIGALDKVKEVLQEVVMLPLRRPGLFKKGNLNVPVKGVLLFGLPGTGKTLSAKAVATEAGANFINITMSSIASKWFGEGEKYVRAVFTLARKLAPAVIFVDEVDSMLGRRERPGEHEAMRKIKNEFMLQWDGLRSSDGDRVLVLASSNRPQDIDSAVLRRFPRRLMVGLPDTESRARILQKICAKEDLGPDVNLAEFASTLEGYSGSDLKNLCVSAAMEPVREILAKEREANGGEINLKPMSASADDEEEVRALQMSDFVKAREAMSPSVSSESASVEELNKWNAMYGENGSRKQDALPYFM